jgi:hypothetical protein
MPRQISQKLVECAILDGYDDAQKTYQQWSGNYLLHTSAEHVVYAFIAKAIWKIPGSKIIKIEQKCKEVRDSACGSLRGRPAHALRINGHIDIVLSWASEKPRAIIEIKNSVYNFKGQCSGDIERITNLLSLPDSSLQFGIFAFYSSAADGKKSAQKKLENRHNSILSRIESSYGDSFEISGSQRVNKYSDSAWASSCIVIKPSR